MSTAPVLIEMTRGALLETVSRGWIAVTRSDGSLVAHAGDPAHVVFPRSAMKPFQAVALVESGAPDRFGYGAAELAVACASHNGERRHREVVRGMLERAGQPISAMLNGADPDWETGQPQAVTDENQLAQNCSGKHAGMVVACAAQGLPVAGYADFEHPYQQQIKQVVASFWGVAPDALIAGRDNCTLPAYAAPLRAVATGWARIADSSQAPAAHQPAIARLADAMAAEPFMVAGSNRLNTLLMETTRGRILAKDGAEGVLCIAVRDQGLGIAFKVEDGSFRTHGAIMLAILRQLGALNADEDAALAGRYRSDLRSNRDQHVGDVNAVFELEWVS